MTCLVHVCKTCKRPVKCEPTPNPRPDIVGYCQWCEARTEQQAVRIDCPSSCGRCACDCPIDTMVWE